jgi:hypothetical protein
MTPASLNNRVEKITRRREKENEVLAVNHIDENFTICNKLIDLMLEAIIDVLNENVPGDVVRRVKREISLRWLTEAKRLRGLPLEEDEPKTPQ